MSSFESLIKGIQKKYERLLKKYRKLEKENKELKANVYKDQEIKKLNEKIEKIKKQNRYYGMTEEMYEEVLRWQAEHLMTIHSENPTVSEFPEFYIKIDESPMGVYYSVVCDKCKSRKYIN